MPERAALLACGDEAGLSFGSAGAALGVLREAPPVVDVSVIGHRRAPAGVRVHRVARLETVRRHGMRVTTPIATLHDLSRVLPAAELTRAVEQAQVLKLVTHAQLVASLTGRPSPALRDALQIEAGFTRSEAEQRLRALIRRAGLPQPQTNARIAGHEVDALWPNQRLVVEIDGFAFHGSRAAFERDRRRDADLQATGYRVLRFTWRQLTREPELVAARIAAALVASA